MWRDEIQQSSFRGVPFIVAQDGEGDRAGGREVHLHEYPAGDRQADPEDVGRAAAPITLVATVLLNDGRGPLDRLLKALDQPGPGELVHHRDGPMHVQAGPYVCRRRGNQATIEMTFWPAPKMLGPRVRADTSALAAAQADLLAQEAVAQYEADRIDEGLPEWAAADSGLSIKQGVEAIFDAYDAYREGDWLGLAEGLRPLGESALAAFQETGLAAQIGDAVMSIPFAPAIAGGAERVFSSVQDLVAQAGPLTTPIRRIAAGNDIAGAALLRRVALAVRVRAASVSDFASFDEAEDLKRVLTGALRAEAEGAADLGQHGVRAALVRTAVATARDLTARAADKARLIRIEAPPGPALALASRLYGDASRASEVLRFAPSPHPLFHPAEGRVLSAAPAPAKRSWAPPGETAPADGDWTPPWRE